MVKQLDALVCRVIQQTFDFSSFTDGAGEAVRVDAGVDGSGLIYIKN